MSPSRFPRVQTSLLKVQPKSQMRIKTWISQIFFTIFVCRFSPRQFTIRLGDIDLQREDEPSNPITVRVADIKTHPKFSRVGFYNDIALFYLDNPVRKSRYVIPLCLPPPALRKDHFAGQRPTVVGWGTTYYGN